MPKLIRAGQRVAICDQIEAPKETTKRGVTELLAPKVQQEQKQEQEQKVGKEENQTRGFHR